MDDLYATGYFDYLDGSRILAVEWSERIPEALPENALHIDFTPVSYTHLPSHRHGNRNIITKTAAKGKH